MAVVVLSAMATAPLSSQRTAPSAGLPRRIVSFVPAATEMLFAIGADDRIVGVSTYDRFPAAVERLPRVGGLLDPNVERLLSLRPDLVIAYGTQTDLRQQLERARVPVLVYTHRDLADVTRTLRTLGERVGLGVRAAVEADRIERDLADVGRHVSDRPRPRTLLVIGHEAEALRQVQASGGYGFLHDLLVLAGADDVLGDLRRESVSMSTEMLLTRAPEIILDLHYGNSLTADRLDAERQIWRALPSVPAVRDNRVHVLIGDEFVVPGPRIVAAAKRLARTLHPAAFRGSR
jgi:iron complex transport system substrate-binding protein